MPDRGKGISLRWAVLLMLPLILGTTAAAYPGVDEAVVQRIAKEHGHEARKPLLDPGEGDQLLFLFLAAGASGGFVAGYYWRKLIGEKKEERR